MEKYSIIKGMKEEKPKLLVVDDEESQADSIKNYFSRRDFVVLTAAKGEEALDIIRDFKPDLILLDMKLAGSMDGRDVLRTLRQNDQDTKVAIITGNMLSEKEIKEIAALGIVEFFIKPVEVHVLEKVVKKVLAERYPKTVRFKTIRQKTGELGDASLRRLIHELSNIAGDITNKCELYTLDEEEGLYKDLTEKERLDKASTVIKSVLQSSERLAGLIKKFSSLAKKEE